MPHHLLITSLALLLTAAPAAARDNFLIILLDDIGVDFINVYSRDDLYGHPGEGANPGPTPNIDALAAEGVLFRNAWTNSSCQPTRAQLLTGRHGFRTGIGTVGGGRLELIETTIPEMLAATHENAALGKWHLGGNNSSHPNLSGFDYYAGATGGGVGDYYSWSKTTNGNTVKGHDVYATTDVVNEAIAAIQGFGANPWFVYLAFNAPHAPFHVPPDSLHTQNVTESSSNTEKYRAMVEAADTEIGRLLESLPQDVYDDTTIFVIGDNGTPRSVTEPPFISTRAKGAIYEGGINVPFIVKSPCVSPEDEGTESLALIGTVDVFATISEIAHAGFFAEDSYSILPYLEDPSAPTGTARPFVYAEQFTPNGGGPYDSHQKAARDGRYKLIWRDDVYEEFYDLEDDRWEQDNLLLETLGPEEQASFDALVDAIEGIEDPPVSVTEGIEVSRSRLQLSTRPNPFRERVTVEFVLPEKTPARVTVHDAAGRRIATLAAGELDAGLRSLGWSDSRSASGVYFVRLETEGATETRRIARIR